MTDLTLDHAPCPICGAPAKFAYDHPDAEIWRCTSCEHAFSRLDTVRVEEQYGSEYYEEEHKNWFLHPNTALFEWINQNIPPKATSLIDIGCGRGDFLRYTQAARPEMELVGVDLSPNMSLPGITYIQGDVMEMEMGRSYDTVVSLAAIEHIEDPLSFARHLRSLCAPNGKVIIMTINEASLLYRLARLARFFGVRMLFDRLYSAHHLHHFSIKSLRSLLVEAGLEVETVHQNNTPLAAVDLPPKLAPIRLPVLAVLGVIFALSRAVSMCLSQTMVSRPTGAPK